MLVHALKNILKCPQMLACNFVTFRPTKLNTQVFSDLTYNQLADPQYTKALILKPIHRHSRVSQRSLFHGKRVSGIIRSCFSEKKHKVFRRVNKFKKWYYSEVLGQKIFFTLSRKAKRTIEKMGGIDNYILCTKPKDLDSKYGEYIRELMLRKINDPTFKVPYIIGTGRQLRVKSFQRHIELQQAKKITIPKDFKLANRTFQRKFGKTPDQLTNQDYAKYLELENLKRTLGDELEPTHPLILELRNKLTQSHVTPEEEKLVNETAEDLKQKFLNHPVYGEKNRLRYKRVMAEKEAYEQKFAEAEKNNKLPDQQ